MVFLMAPSYLVVVWLVILFLVSSIAHSFPKPQPYNRTTSKVSTVLSSSSSHGTSSSANNVCLNSHKINDLEDYTTKTSRDLYTRLGLDVSRLQTTIRQGRVYQQDDFVSSDEITAILQDIGRLQDQGKFERSGLSNTASYKQGFGNQDRSVCPVPWWKQALEKYNHDESLDKDSTTTVNNLDAVSDKLQQLRYALSSILDRPTLTDASLAHECYYSTAGKGSFLPRHMDERHEELKGSKGWLLPSRRSLSWLVYVSDPDWTLTKNGGALRAYPQDSIHGMTGSQHNGNLQVGWLRNNALQTSQPVYLDSWYPVPSPDSQSTIPACVLYTVSKDQDIVLLTQPWSNDALQGISASEFIQFAAQEKILFVDETYATNFVLLEDRPAWDQGHLPDFSKIQDVSPTRGSLVIFDSVIVPHQVEVVHEGQRVAIAGWFHEATQQFPEELFST